MSSNAGDDVSPSGCVVHLHLAELDELLGELMGDVRLVRVVGAVSSPMVRHAASLLNQRTAGRSDTEAF
jgi:hypothetical protein